MKKQTIGLGILAIAVISGAAFFAAEKNKKTPAVETPIVADTVPPPEPDEQPSGKIDEHLTINNELRDVNFCGKTYKVKQVLIDGVDVVQRVAELATNDLIPETFKSGPYGPQMNEWETLTLGKGELARSICENLDLNAFTRETKVILLTHTGKTADEEGYGFLINEGSGFVVFSTTYDIYKVDDYMGGIFGPIGKLK